jgi:acyl-CoA thioesterase
MDASTLARAYAASRTLGLELIAVGAGQAVLAMTVSETMVNWRNTCHGGFIYLLADTAFGYASNSLNQRMVAQHCSITYLCTVKRGEWLTAYAAERQRAGRAGIYDVAVKRQVEW